jgi:hypothetical protein
VLSCDVWSSDLPNPKPQTPNPKPQDLETSFNFSLTLHKKI